MSDTALQPAPADKAAIFFQTDHLRSELKSRTVRGGAVTMLGQLAKFILNLASTFILFRMLKLKPSDAGLIIMVTTVTGLVSLFKDLGLSRATIQRDTITREQTSTLFWVNVAIGVLATIITFAIAPAIASYYGKPELVKITIVMGLAFLISGTAVQHQALLQRQMQFSTIAVIDTVSMIFGIVLAVVLALAGAGYWALVLQQVGATVANNVGTWIACPWRPGKFQRGTGVKSMLKFGGNLAGFNILNYMQRTFDNALIGRYGGDAALGLYGKAYGLLMLPITQISTPMSNVAVPALSRLQKDPEKYRSYYRKAIEMITTVSMPIVVLLYVIADEVVVTLLGKGFVDAAPIFRWLVPAAFIGTFNVGTGWVYVSLARTGRQMRMAMVVTPITLAGFVVGGWLGGKYWGAGFGTALGVAISFSVTTILLRYPTILYCFHGTPLRSSDMLGAIWRPATASLLAGVALFALDRTHLFESMLPGARLIVQAAIYMVLYLAAWCVLPGGRKFLGSTGDLFREMLGKKKPKKETSGFPVVAPTAAVVIPSPEEAAKPTADAVPTVEPVSVAGTVR